MSRIPVALTALVLLLPLSGAAQKPAADAPIDGLSASPANFILLENDYVRVLEYKVQPGQRDQWHTHPPKVSYIAEGGTLRVTTADGQSFVGDEKAGTAEWGEAFGRHFVENVGKTPVRIILTEMKRAR